MAYQLKEESEIAEVKLSKKDFESDQEVRWCPGCGDYSILATVQRFLPTLGIPRERYVFVAGIGCSSRFPYYMNTYGLHTIHGRAPAVASGLKASNPDLSVWVITGDGDALSIGGNHLMHLIRRNLDINVLLFNNRIYGLTKGQYSPTSEVGKVTKSTPYGSVDQPLNPVLYALGCRAGFVARSLDVDAKHLTSVLKAACDHRGTSFIEIYQNCNIFNDGAFEHISERKLRAERQVILEDGKPMVFGSEKNKGIAIKGLAAEVVEFDPDDADGPQKAGVSLFEIGNPILAQLLAGLDHPKFPVPMGVFYREERPVFESALAEQQQAAIEKWPVAEDADENLRELFHAGDTWVVD